MSWHNLPSTTFSIPVAVVGVLIAPVGLLEVFISGEGRIKTLLFPTEMMFRTTSAGIPFDDTNDLEMTQEEVTHER